MDTLYLAHVNDIINSEHYLNEETVQTIIQQQKIEADQLFFTSILNNENS